MIGQAKSIYMQEDLPKSNDDALLTCIALITNLLGQPIHLAALKSGFALDDFGRIPPEAVPDLMQRHHMLAAWSRHQPSSMPNYTLPVIVPFIDGRAVVLKAIKDGIATVLYAETGMTDQQMTVEELDALATGELLIIKPPPKKGDQQLVGFKTAAFSWFWNTMWRFRHFYYDAMVATVVANLLTLATVFFTMNVFNRIIPAKAYTSLWTLTIGVLIAMLLEFGMRLLKARLVDQGGKKADLAINATLLREIMAVRLDHRPQSIGIFASSMRDFESLRDFFSSSLFVAIADLPFVFMFLALIWVIGGPIVWVPIAIIPILLVLSFIVQRPLMSAMRRSMREAGERQSVLMEAMMNLEMLKAHNAEGYLQRRWEAANIASSESFMDIRHHTAVVTGITTTLQQLCSVGVIVVGVYLIHDNTLTLGALIACNILAGRAVMPLGSMMQLATRYQQAKTSLETLDGLMRRPRDRDYDHRYIVPESFTGSLRAENIEFAYPSEHVIPVVNKVSFSLAPEDRMALLGPVGCGKSTLIRMMAGLYKPKSGNILINDLDILQIDPTELRSKIGYVGQDAQLFMGSLRENLVLSDSWISDARVIDVLTQLGLYNMVKAHPRGLDMPLTEAGGGLSGGQRQLLTVARMMLRDPVFVFMDEPTANMDQDTEARVIKVIGEWLKGRTLLISTHRPQLLVWVNRIAVMQKGQIVSEGPRDEILQKLSKTAQVAKKISTDEPKNLNTSNGAAAT
jgi:ATP-binding cassette subfamily C protein LapB